jgi:hypothetical protein
LRALVATSVCVGAPSAALAEPPADDVLTPLDAREVRRDIRVAAYDEPGDGAPLWLSVAGGVTRTGDGVEGLGMLSLGGALERTAAPTRAKEALTKPTSAAKRADEPIDGAARPTDAPTPPAPEVRPRPHPDDAPPPVEPRIDGAFARGLVRAARARAHERDDDERIDGLAKRARLSGLLPEVRVRVARVTSTTQALSPTEYDPTRVTSSDGAGLWLEGRATFRLDRLVFADDEVALERLRIERDRMDRSLVADVLAELALYQRGAARAADATLPDDDRVTAEIQCLSAAAALDVLTDGWFSSHAPKPAP